VEELLAHLLAVQGLQHRLEPRGERLEVTGERVGRDRQALICQILQIAVTGLAVAVFAQDDLNLENRLLSQLFDLGTRASEALPPLFDMAPLTRAPVGLQPT
jgi:hypothetical protein